MNPFVKMLWTSALRSGTYKQAFYDLKISQFDSEDGKPAYCVLGVLAQVYCEEKGLDFDTVTRRADASDIRYKILPPQVANWAGLEVKSLSKDSGVNPALEKDRHGNPVYCTTLNDSQRLSFDVLADKIDKAL